jgi:folate-binding protein YgfZ
MTTLHFTAFPEKTARWGAFLNGRSGIVAVGMFDSFSEGFRLWLSPEQGRRALEHIEQFHFAEQMQVENVSARWHLAALANAPAPFLQEISYAVWKDGVFPLLTWIAVPKSDWLDFSERIRREEIPWLGERIFESIRMRAGKGRMGIEIEERDLILSSSWEDAVDRNKGCYPGQEVVERIFTYGQVNKKLLPVEIVATRLPDPPFEFSVGDTVAGRVLSFLPMPGVSNRAIGLATVGRQFWETGAFEIPGAEIRLKALD